MTEQDNAPLSRLRELTDALPAPEARQAIEALLEGPLRAARRPLGVGRLGRDDAPWVAEAWSVVAPALAAHAATATPDKAVMLVLAVRYAPHPSAISPLEAMVSGGLPAEVRAAALEALGEIDDDRAAAVARTALGSEDAPVRAAAARALGRLASHAQPDDAQRLVALITEDPSPDVRQWGAIALGELAALGHARVDVLWHKVDAAVDVFPEVLTGAAVGLSAAAEGPLAHEVVTGLLDRIEQGRIPVQRAAIEAAALIPVASIPQPLRWRMKRALGDLAGEAVPNGRVAAWAIARRGDPAGRAYLVLEAQRGGLEGFEATMFLAELETGVGLLGQDGAP